jgi:uncharacterized protein YydD (DUF2326 family)
MDYSELLEKYKLLQNENDVLRAEIAKLNAKLMKYSPAEKIYEDIINKDYLLCGKWHLI